MTRRLHTRSGIFFNNPYVVRVDYADGSINDNAEFEKHYHTLCKKTYALTDDTWGCSPLVTSVDVGDDNISVRYTVRGYFVFKNKIDALQFKLSCDITNIRVHMWPSKLEFTIHEFIEDPALQQSI
jgi:hypothetical protein